MKSYKKDNFMIMGGKRKCSLLVDESLIDLISQYNIHADTKKKSACRSLIMTKQMMHEPGLCCVKMKPPINKSIRFLFCYLQS